MPTLLSLPLGGGQLAGHSAHGGVLELRAVLDNAEGSYEYKELTISIEITVCCPRGPAATDSAGARASVGWLRWPVGTWQLQVGEIRVETEECRPP